MPAPSSSTLPAAACPRSAPYTKPAKPAPKPRRAPALAADPALDTLGAVYIGWGAGKRDPAPLCCAVQARASLVRTFGEAAVGYMAVQPQLPLVSPQKPQHRVARLAPSAALASLPLGPLPPLPPLPRVRSAPANMTPSFSPGSLSPLTSAGFASSPLGGTASTPATSIGSPSDLYVYGDALQKDRTPTIFDDTTLALPLVDSRPSSPRLAAVAAQHSGTSFVPSFSLSLAPLPEYTHASDIAVAPTAVVKAEEELDDEALWSAGEDPLWNCAATDVMSEASWAW